MIKEVAWRGKGSGGGVQGLRFRGLTRTKRRKMAFFEGCPVGWGGVPTGAGGRGGRPRLDSRRRGQGRVGLGKRLGGYGGLGGRGVREAGQGLGGGCKGFGSGGVSGRGTGPRDGANFATCVVFLLFLTRTKRRKMAFFEGCPVGWGGGYTPELAWWTGG